MVSNSKWIIVLFRCVIFFELFSGYFPAYRQYSGWLIYFKICSAELSIKCYSQFYFSFILGPVSFQDLNDDKIRQLVKINPETKKPYCPLCKNSFVNKVKAFEHIRSIHIGRKDIPCLYCSKELFSTLTLRNKHIYKLHGEQHKLAKLLPS
jgi:hypothetical protein